MKLRGLTMTMGLLLAVALILSASQANSLGILRANIPFSFYIENQQLPAGEYLISRSDIGRALTVARLNGNEKVSVLTFPAGSQKAAEGSFLSFNKYGNVHFLRTVASADTSVSGSLLESKREKTLATEMAKAGRNDSRAQVRLTIPSE